MITKNISSMFQKCVPWSSLMIGEMHCSFTSFFCSVRAMGKVSFTSAKSVKQFKVLNYVLEAEGL